MVQRNCLSKIICSWILQQGTIGQAHCLNRYAYFYPSVGISAILSDMLKMPSWISFGKVSAALTKVGNDADPYLLNPDYNYTRGAYGGYIGSSATKSIGDLKPEQTQSLELGTEWSFINNRFGLAFTLLQNKF